MIAPMTKVNIAFPRHLTTQILRFLQESELVHIIPASTDNQPNQTTPPATSRLAQIQFCLDFLTTVRQEFNLKPAKPKLKDRFKGNPQASLAELESRLEQLNLNQKLAEIKQHNQTLADIAIKQRELTEEKNLLEPWANLDITGAYLTGTTSSQVTLISLGFPEESLVQKQLTAIPTAIIQEINRQTSKNKKTGTIYWEVVAHKQDRARLHAVLKDTNATAINLPLSNQQTPRQRLAQIKQLLQDLKKQRHNLLQPARQLLKLELEFKYSYDALLHQQERERAQDQIIFLATSALIAGWLPRKFLRSFQKQLRSAYPSAYLSEVTPQPNERPPVALHNSSAIKPFEAVTDLYGKPAYHDLDPTPFLSLFFLISFGLALSDAGYGFVMATLTALTLKFIPLKRDLKKMIKLLMYTGFSTMVFGALMGSWFSIDLAKFSPNPLADLLLKLKILDPISQPITLLFVAFAIGLVQLLSARLIKAYDYYRQGRIKEALLDEVSWFTFISLLLAWIYTDNQILLWLTIANATLLVFTQGRQQKNIFVKFGSGLISLYGLINFMSDTLSYARLLALGLATGIIGLVVNLMADLVSHSFPIIGLVLAAVVLIIGHVFNLGINALGAFIHSGRLQFVEFFPKFIEGGGLAYKPLGRVGKYVDSPQEFSSI